MGVYCWNPPAKKTSWVFPKLRNTGPNTAGFPPTSENIGNDDIIAKKDLQIMDWTKKQHNM